MLFKFFFITKKLEIQENNILKEYIVLEPNRTNTYDQIMSSMGPGKFFLVSLQYF